MSEVHYILDPNTNKEFRILINDLNIFCKDLPLDLYVTYIYDTLRNENVYSVNVSDFESYEDRVITYIRIEYDPRTDIYKVSYPYFFKGKPDYMSALNKTYSPTNTDAEIKSTDDIYEMIIKYIKKGISNYEMDKENK